MILSIFIKNMSKNVYYYLLLKNKNKKQLQQTNIF